MAIIMPGKAYGRYIHFVGKLETLFKTAKQISMENLAR